LRVCVFILVVGRENLHTHSKVIILYNILYLMALPQINLEALSAIGGKPKDYYLLEFFRLYEKYWDTVIDHPEDVAVVDFATGLLLGTCPDKKMREDLWNTYVKIKTTGIDGKKKTLQDAAVLTVGDLWTYLNTTMEFTEEAYAG
jgi:hypothetical protein